MKRVFAVLLSAVLLLGLLPGCRDGAETAGPTQPAGPSEEPSQGGRELTCMELAEAALSASGCEDPDSLERLTGGDELLSAYIENAYALEGPWEDAAVIRAAGASAFEIAVLRLADGEAAVQANISLMSYLFRRQGDFSGYAPAQADMAANGGIRQEDEWAALFICPDPDGADEAFQRALVGDFQPGPVETEEPAGSPEPSAVPEPQFAVKDLLSRLLLEAACPEWTSILKTYDSVSSYGRDKLEAKVKAKYGITPEQYEDFVGSSWEYWYEVRLDEDHNYVTTTCYGYEVAVFQAESEDAAEELAQALGAYLAYRLGEHQKLHRAKAEDAQKNGADPKVDVATEENSRVVHFGRYAALIISEHLDDTVWLFPRAVNSNDTQDFYMRYLEEKKGSMPVNRDEDWPDREKFVQPNKDDMSLYDTSAIRAAWAQGDPAGLSDADRAVYDAARQILGEILTEGMSDYDKELAIYGWLVDNVGYDWTHQNILAATPRKSFEPYGGLVDRRAVCLGYAASFQLLMDLAEVECITVVGAAFHSAEDHAWNMVRLDGDWYCVDVTWDANQREQLGLSGLENWDYFNVTSDDMALNHQWDYANVPEAAAQDGGRK